MFRRKFLIALALLPVAGFAAQSSRDAEFFEARIRPILVEHCYECHSEQANERKGGLLLDRRMGWMKGGDTDKAVVPGNPAASLLITAVRHTDEDLQMPPKVKLSAGQIAVLEQWVRRGAPGPKEDPGETEFSDLGDQEAIFAKARTHWAFQPVDAADPAPVSDARWNESAIDRLVFAKLAENGLKPSPRADERTLLRRLSHDLTGLPPTPRLQGRAIAEVADELMASPAFGEHLARLWLDVARYADTDSFYRPDTRTPHYFPFAFTYRDYAIGAFNADKPFDQFLREQFAADLLGFGENAPELAALGFWAVGPHAKRNPDEAMDDWIDVTTRGLMGLTAACARCHDHKYEPVPTADYYSLRGVFASVTRMNPLDEKNQPVLASYQPSDADRAAYTKARAEIDAKITAAAGKKARGNNRSVSQKIRETELAELLAFHPGAPARMMGVMEAKKPSEPVVFVRGDKTNPGERVPRRFLKILDPEQAPFSPKSSGRLDLAEKIVDPQNPLTARVFVNRVWGYLMGSHLVATPSNFGLEGAAPTHPALLDWLAADFVEHGWSAKHLVRQIVLSQTYQQASSHRQAAAEADPENRLLWRANRKRLSIEALRDGMLALSGNLDRAMGGRPGPLWGPDYTRRRAIYGFINRFNLDPTLRAFDFPTPMQSQPARGESIVPPQALFSLNSPFAIDRAAAVVAAPEFQACSNDEARVRQLFRAILQREPDDVELPRVLRFAQREDRPLSWPLIAQSLLMSNEFHYLD